MLRLFALLLLFISADFITYKTSKNNSDVYVPAIRFWRPLAKLGFSTAQYNLAVRYERGKGVTPDINQAFKWYRKSAEQGNSKAQLKLGNFYEAGLNASGNGVPRDIDEAYKWYRKSALQGYPPAQLQLGWLINSGLGAPQNFREVIYWTRKAADQGYAEAQFLLGWRYFFGKRVSQDIGAARFWFDKAAIQTHGRAQHYLGILQNDETVIKLIREAAEHGDAESQYIIGWRYFIGKDVPQDYHAAEFWLRKASIQRHHTALRYMGLIYEEGKGKPKDSDEALKWYHSSSELGNGDSQIRLNNKLQGWD